ncbi:MAG: oligoribonuclease [Actinomycetota bacterium]|nr:oligoribonuclease [Actinomycetota bacterium]
MSGTKEGDEAQPAAIVPEEATASRSNVSEVALMQQPLVWVDLEMTGLDPERHHIVEIAVIVTDGALERVQEGPDLVVAAPAGALAAMDPVVVRMHEASGLIGEIRAATLTVGQAESQVLRFLSEHVPDSRSAPLAGNSVHADRAFLRRHMPELEAYVHYRNVDVSTIKELARRWYPEVFEGAPAKDDGHRALADIRASIQELRYYRRSVFR